MRNAREQQFALSRPSWQLLLFAALLAGFATPGLTQSDTAKTRNQLQQLEKDIKRINWEISSARTSHNKLQQQLRTAEVELGTLNRDISGNQRAMKSGKEELAGLEQQRGTLEEARNQQQARIALELKTAWQMGRQGQVKVLLNQESPHTVARSLCYYSYFFRARNTLLSQYRATLQELQQLQ
jgi:septal ring factor EnvC (AmiA/AmiB activator)